jgi:hypothetical protein
MLLAALSAASAQTKIVPPRNSYSISDDIKLGQEAAAQARKELPIFKDDTVHAYVEGIGARLVAAIPPEFGHPEFKYTFEVINQKEINAFALPGGPMFLNRGMMEAAGSEDEMVGVMAHEISHVALRHGTAQATRSSFWQILSGVGQAAGAIVGGGWGNIVGLGAQIGPGLVVMKYGREAETQADLLGAQILARAGYDPREMAKMFKTIEAEGGGGGPQWMSSHPNPGNRYAAITKEAEALAVQGKADTSQFAGIQARLKAAGPAYTAEQIAKGAHKTGNAPGASPGGTAKPVTVDPPSSRWQTTSPAKFFQVSVPSNWSRVSGSSLIYAPGGAVHQSQDGEVSYTHGVQFGTAQGTGNLQQDTQALLSGLARSNPQLRSQSGLQRDTLGGRQALSTTLSNVSSVTGQPETVVVTTTSLPDGSVFFVVGVVPQREARAYAETLRRVRTSVKIAAQ